MKQSLPDLAAVGNFVILATLLYFLLRKPVKNFLINRSDEIAKNLRESEELRAQALKMLSQYQEKISKLDVEVEQILNKAKKDGDVEKEKILARAEKMSEQIVENAKRSAQREAADIRKRIEKQFVEKAMLEAKEEITKKVSKVEHQAFVEYFINQMENQRGLNR